MTLVVGIIGPILVINIRKTLMIGKDFAFHAMLNMILINLVYAKDIKIREAIVKEDINILNLIHDGE